MALKGDIMEHLMTEDGRLVIVLTKQKVTPMQWAVMHGVCRKTVYRMLKTGRLKGEMVGSRWRIDPDAVIE